jgi:hypothetical protein
MFKDELALRVGEKSRWDGKKLKRSYYTSTIPESVVIRVYERYFNKRNK